MKIGIYAPVLEHDKLTGIGRYVYEILKRLPAIFPENEFIIISHRRIKHNPFDRLKNVKVKIIAEHRKIMHKIPSALWFRYFSSKIINNFDIDYVWCTTPITPLFLKENIKKVVNVYDFNLYIVPHTMQLKTKIGYKLFFKKAINEADKIIVISKGTADKLESFFNKKADVIIRPAVDTSILKKIQTKPYDFKYILSVSTIEPRKNIKSLINAFISLKKEGNLKNIKLVLVGSSGWKNKEVIKMIKEYKNDIVYTGYVSDEKLAQLYSNAEVFVFPSIYEGFGIPVLEAKSCGCCVITTNIPELREACGEGCIYINPDKDNIKKALKDFFDKRVKCRYHNNHIIKWDTEVKKLEEIFL